MPRKGKGGKWNRQGGQAALGGAAPGPSSSPNPTASGGANAGSVLHTNNPPRPVVPAVVVSDHTNRSTAQDQVQAATPGFLAPPRRSNRNPRWIEPIEPDRLTEMRRVFTSGADQVLAKPPPKLNVTVHVVLPGHRRGFKDVDPSDVDIQAVFAQIAKEFEARIEAKEVGSAVSVTVKTTNRDRAKQVIATLRDRLLYHRGEEGVWRAQLLVHPPRDGKGCFRAVLLPKEGTTGRRVTAAATEGLNLVDPSDLAAALTEYKAELNHLLESTASVLRLIPNGMRMRVYFGTLVLDEWKKGDNGYNFADLKSLLRRAGARGTAHMLKLVGGTSIKALKDRLSANNEELPEPVRAFLDTEPDRTYSLILETKNLHIESTFEPVQAQGTLAEKITKVQYTLGPLATQQQEKQDRAAEIVTVCPESHHDWALEVRKSAAEQDTNAKAPFTVQELQRNLQFTGESLGEDFPGLAIYNRFLQAHDIQRVHGKATWRYMVSTRYTIEINLFHEWAQKTPGQTSSATMPATSGTVALYSYDWDDDMLAGAAPPRPWQAGFAAQFLQQGDGELAPKEQPNKTATESLDHFLLWVEWIQKALDEGLGEGKEESSSAGGGA